MLFNIEMITLLIKSLKLIYLVFIFRKDDYYKYEKQKQMISSIKAGYIFIKSHKNDGQYK